MSKVKGVHSSWVRLRFSEIHTCAKTSIFHFWHVYMWALFYFFIASLNTNLWGFLLVNRTFCFKSQEWRHVISVDGGIPALPQIKLTISYIWCHWCSNQCGYNIVTQWTTYCTSCTRLATSLLLGERSEPCLAGKRPNNERQSSREVDLSRLMGFHLHFEPKMVSGVTRIWGFRFHLWVHDFNGGMCWFHSN